MVRMVVLGLLLVTASGSAVAEPREVLGYGVRMCPAYVAAFAGWEANDAAGIIEYQRYREWLAGLVTGLSLATGDDVLRGVEVKGAMRRIQILCEEDPQQDLFTTTMGVVRTLSSLE